MRMRFDLSKMILALGLCAAPVGVTATEPAAVPEVMDVEVDPGVSDPRGDVATAPADPREEDKMVCTNVVCGDDEVTAPTCSTCSTPAR